MCFFSKYSFFICFTWVGKHDFHEKPIELRFWKRVGSLVFERILCCEDDKWGRYVESCISDGDAFFFHSFEKCGLYLWRSTIDLIGEEDICKNWSFSRDEFSFLWSVYLISREVWWEQIWGKWHAFCIETEDARERANGFCFPESRNSLDECMSSWKYRDNEFFYQFILPDDIFLYFIFYCVESFIYVSEGWIEHKKIANNEYADYRFFVIFAKKKISLFRRDFWEDQ